MTKISFIIPAYNEKKNISKLYSELKKLLKKIKTDYQIVFVNDGSIDQTEDAVKQIKKEDEKIILINLSRNFWYESAVKAGLDIVDWDFIVIMDSDLQDPPQVVEKLYETIKKGYDIVLAKRSSRSDWFIKDKTAWFFYRFINMFSDVVIPQDVWYFRIFSKQVLEEVRKFWEYSLFLKWIFSYVGFRVATIEFERPQRQAWNTKFSFKQLINIAIRGIFSFSTVPLKWIMFIWLFSAGISFVIWITQFVLKIIHPESYQYWLSTLVVLVAFITGVQLICLWVLGIYIGRIYEETKKRPVYIIRSVE